ncbi:MAG TPA: 30S ribosomal protein S17 [candidate division Zixibacteria bacterium]|nr:30S ribosomal protein S17 [candidate division Zixibacteria bacterium]
MTETTARNTRKVRIGKVVSDKGNKSIVVRVDRTVRHPLYFKPVRTYSKFYAHDEKNEAHIGDVVRIMETRPISKTKHWRLVEIVEKAD